HGGKKGLPGDGVRRQYAAVYQMSTVAVNPISSKPPGTVPTDPRVPSDDFARPVVKPGRSAFQLLGEVLAHGGPGYLQFAITNICNAKCDFCGFAVDRFDPKQRRSVTLQEARDVIDIAVKNHIGYLLFVGGEPLVHRDLRAMVRY